MCIKRERFCGFYVILGFKMTVHTENRDRSGNSEMSIIRRGLMGSSLLQACQEGAKNR